MIVKNEELVLGRCLDSVKKLVDEIVIVDTGSTDNTKNIAKEYTDKIYDFIWIDDFSAARNYSFSKGTKDFILWLDADDIILEKDALDFMELKKSLSLSTDIVNMKYNVSFDKDDNPTFTFYRERLIKNSPQFKWVGAVHEIIPPIGNIINSDIAISHKKLKVNDPERNLKIYNKLIANNELLTPRDLYYYGRELYYNSKYEEAINYLNEFLDSNMGWVEDCISACQILSFCYNSINKPKEALDILFKSFRYSYPRAEICCDIGQHFLNENNYEQAIFWYELASKSKKNSEGFISIDCYGYIPYMQLCLCYYKIGNCKKSEEYNELAGEIKPLDSAYLYNKNFFESIKNIKS